MSLFSDAFSFLSETLGSVQDIFSDGSILGDIAKAGLETFTGGEGGGGSNLSFMRPNSIAGRSSVGVRDINAPGYLEGLKSVDIQATYDEWARRLAVLAGEYDDVTQ